MVTQRPWGSFQVLCESDLYKVKKLVLDPGGEISYQYHHKRNEVWFISKGACRVNFSDSQPDAAKLVELKTEDIFQVKAGCWHQIFNPYAEKCHIIEIQYGEETIEDDIERLYLYEKDT